MNLKGPGSLPSDNNDVTFLAHRPHPLPPLMGFCSLPTKCQGKVRVTVALPVFPRAVTSLLIRTKVVSVVVDLLTP